MIFRRRFEGLEAGIKSPSKHPTIETLERLFELSLDMLGTASADGYFTQLNPAYERILGWTREELMAKPIVSFLHPDDVKAASERLTQTAAPAGGPIVLEQRVRARDGTYRWIQSSVVPRAVFVTLSRRTSPNAKRSNSLFIKRPTSCVIKRFMTPSRIFRIGY